MTKKKPRVEEPTTATATTFSWTPLKIQEYPTIALYAVSTPQDFHAPPSYTFTPAPSPTLEEMRRIIREEIERMDKIQRKRARGKKVKP